MTGLSRIINSQTNVTLRASVPSLVSFVRSCVNMLCIDVLLCAKKAQMLPGTAGGCTGAVVVHPQKGP